MVIILNSWAKFVKSNYYFIKGKKIIFFFFIGLFIRVLAMPFTAMSDITHNYYVAAQIVFKNIFFLDPSFVANYINAFFLLVFKSIIPFSSFPSGPGNLTTWWDWTLLIREHFISQPNVFLKLFLMKMPYLLFDIGVLLLLPLFFNKEKDKRFAFIFWLFNPVAIVVSFVFGCPDIIGVFFMLLAYYFIFKERVSLALIFVLLALFSKSITVLLIPLIIIFVLKLKKKIYEKVIILLSSIVLFIILLSWLIPKSIAKNILENWPYNYFFQTKIGEMRLLYLFVIAYSLILISYWYFSDSSFNSLIKYSLISLFSFYALCFFHPQWFLLAMPFVCFVLIEKKGLIKIFVLQLAFYFSIFLWWGNHLTINLFAPLSPKFILSLPDIKDIISKYFMQYEVLINIFWSVFVAITIFFTYLIVRSAKT